ALRELRNELSQRRQGSFATTVDVSQIDDEMITTSSTAFDENLRRAHANHDWATCEHQVVQLIRWPAEQFVLSLPFNPHHGVRTRHSDRSRHVADVLEGPARESHRWHCQARRPGS